MSKNVIVLGMHRGGTSLIANLLYSYGAYAGDVEKLMKADEGNQRGYWEYLPLVEFDNELLASVGARWFIPPPDESHKELVRKASEVKYNSRASHLIETMQEGGHPWFWKDPRLSVLLPFWEKIWGDVIYIIILRHPLDIALSLRKRNNYPISGSLLIWQRYMLAILKGTESAQHKCFFEYERLIKDPVEQCERLYLFLSRYFESKASKQQTIDNMAQTISPELRHNKNDSSFLSAPQATVEQKALFSFLKRMVENPVEHVDQTNFTTYPGWQEYLLTIDAMLQLWHFMPSEMKRLALSQMPVSLKEQFGLIGGLPS